MAFVLESTLKQVSEWKFEGCYAECDAIRNVKLDGKKVVVKYVVKACNCDNGEGWVTMPIQVRLEAKKELVKRKTKWDYVPTGEYVENHIHVTNMVADFRNEFDEIVKSLN